MKVRKIPRGTFWIGGLAGLALCLPLTTVALRAVYARFHLGPAGATDLRIGLFAAIFAGLPTLLTAGGVARLVAHRLAERAAARGPATGTGWGLLTGALAMALGGVGTAILTAVPLGGLPDRPERWWPIGAAGLSAGLVTGLAIAVLVAGRTLRHGRRAGGAEAAPAGDDGASAGA